jgi:2-keto-4-pentenoate hydratase/2-oxohepta-3-ene-1,7-dioic acid hydratase in catechol pathway
LNYRDHAAESGMEVPPEPVIFFKATTSLCGPNDAVIIPRGGTKLDWEIELAVVIGRVARYVDADHADAYVAGYALHNDYSERAFQLERGGQWVKGKSADTFAPARTVSRDARRTARHQRAGDVARRQRTAAAARHDGETWSSGCRPSSAM